MCKVTARTNAIIGYLHKGQVWDLEDWGDNLCHKETCEKADGLFQSIYTEAVGLANEFDVEEKSSQS